MFPFSFSLTSFSSRWFDFSRSPPDRIFSPNESKESNFVQSNNVENSNQTTSILQSSSSPSYSPDSSAASAKTLAKCDRLRQNAVLYSRRVGYMLRSLALYGCEIDPQTFIRCVHCPPGSSHVAFFEQSGVGRSSIGVCDSIVRQDEFDTLLTHELIHSFDFCRADVSVKNLNHHACTEIRAANLSGDCTFKREFRRGIFAVSDHHNKCVKRRAAMSIMGNPGIKSPAEAEAAVEAVFERCSKDFEPFGGIPF